MATTRRLTTILAVDVVGYSRLMGADEEGTHDRLKAHFEQLIYPKVAQRRGRRVKNTGDGALIEFPSVVDAVRCAAEIQRGMIDRDLEIPEERRIKLRIGVNLGDVIVEPDDIFGDGVNVAARLEALAEPGGICVSGTVHDEIRNRLTYPFDEMGERSVKNISRPIRVYGLTADNIAALPKEVVPTVPQPARSPRRHPIWLVGAITGVLIVIGGLWWLWQSREIAATSAAPLVAPRLSIVVLPFANLSNDPDQQYLADGITEELTTDLSRIAHMFVISASTAFTYRDKPTDARQIARELGVRYLLEGSVQRSGGRVRLNVQLIDGGTAAHLWAEHFDSDTSDLFALQDEITRRIAASLKAELIAVEARRPVESPDALDFMLKGRAIALQPPTPELNAETIAMYERALAAEPASVEAQALLSLALLRRVFFGPDESRESDIARAKELIERVSAASPRSWTAHHAKATMLRAEGRCTEAIPEYEAATASNPNMPDNYAGLGWCKLATGAIDEVIPLEQQAIRLSPRDPLIGVWEWRIGVVHLLQFRTDEALVWFEKACSDNPGAANMHAWLASAYALNGGTARAAAELAEARRLDPNSVEAQTLSLLGLLRRVFFGADEARAKELIEQASAASPPSWITHYAKAALLGAGRAGGRCAEAIPEYEAAIASNRNIPDNYGGLGWCKLATGALDEVIPLEQQAIRLSPRDPVIGIWEWRIGIVHLLQFRTDEALVWFKKACKDSPGSAYMHAWLASAYALNGATARAAAELAEARRLEGEGSFFSIAKVKSDWKEIAGIHSSISSPEFRALVEATFFTGLRKAGMPEE